jgi:RNA polymerase sigma factor (TIGR02999 family)
MKNLSKDVDRKPSDGDLTLLLSDTTNPDALKTVMRLAYNELHRMAIWRSGGRPTGRSLQPTDLLNESCIRLLQSKTAFKNRRHFFGAASKTMRRILVESARRRRAHKRGGDLQRVDLSEAEGGAFERPSDLLDFHAALTRLARVQPSWSEVAELRVFGGWSTIEVATILQCGESTARRRWANARKWLASTLAKSSK